MRVALFVTCLNDTMFPGVGRATVDLLERLGVAVDFPAAQTCCGQMHFNSGYRAASSALASSFAAAFAGYDVVVCPSASCAAMVRAHHRGLVGAVAPPVFELSEFLVDILGVEDVGAHFPHVVAYHDTCHARRVLGVGDRPRRLLAAVDGLRLVELSHPEECCGFGGTFSVKNAETSTAIGADKADDVLACGAQVLAAGDTSCLLHIGGVLSRRGVPVRTVHLAEILAATR